MMQIIPCKNCGVENMPLDAISVKVTLEKSKFCKSCYQSAHEEQSHHFCSEKCFQEYDKEKLKWKN